MSTEFRLVPQPTLCLVCGAVLCRSYVSMSNGDSKILRLYSSLFFKDKSSISAKREMVSTVLYLVSRPGSYKATVTVYNTGKIVVGGPDSKLETLLQDMLGGRKRRER